MAAPITSATAAYASALAKSDAPGMDPPAGDGSSFAGALKSAIGSVVDDVHSSEKATVAGIAGKTGLAEVVNAVNNADVALQAALAVRDRMVQAYQEVLRMPM
ncbi:MAG: flagellar hook-basal body complex protein FliE [Alphaproteobacteria bacterium]|nr:flagellar hook-basal body complex protein FliE [Alphaproteobacteria bacterium]